jgi:hypothetical protein
MQWVGCDETVKYFVRAVSPDILCPVEVMWSIVESSSCSVNLQVGTQVRPHFASSGEGAMVSRCGITSDIELKSR